MAKKSASRREFLRLLGLSALVPVAAKGSGLTLSFKTKLKPPALRPGDTVALVNPAGAVFDSDDIAVVQERLAALGFKTKVGRHALARYGYLAGTDQERAEDLNQAFADENVKGIIAIRGGWGCARMLPYLDYRLIRKHPKVVMGYSDVTALLLALQAKCDLVTFHGPVGLSTWNEFSVNYFREVVMEGKTPLMQNPEPPQDELVATDYRIRTVTPGKARGKLLGGNLSVLTALIGTPYLPDFKGAILFLEEVEEEWYRVDRMLTQLKLAGLLEKLVGFVFGKCTRCSPGEGYGSLSFEDLLNDHIKPLGIPVFTGAMIGHLKNKFTVPLGVEAEIDATAGTIKLMETAVS